MTYKLYFNNQEIKEFEMTVRTADSHLTIEFRKGMDMVGFEEIHITLLAGVLRISYICKDSITDENYPYNNILCYTIKKDILEGSNTKLK